MYFSDRIKLRSVAVTYDSAGFAIETPTTVEVWADKRSVARTEFYAAHKADMRVDMMFVVQASDYSEQREIEHGGVVYDVIRTYQTGSETIELTCARR